MLLLLHDTAPGISVHYSMTMMKQILMSQIRIALAELEYRHLVCQHCSCEQYQTLTVTVLLESGIQALWTLLTCGCVCHQARLSMGHVGTLSEVH